MPSHALCAQGPQSRGRHVLTCVREAVGTTGGLVRGIRRVARALLRPARRGQGVRRSAGPYRTGDRAHQTPGAPDRKAGPTGRPNSLVLPTGLGGGGGAEVTEQCLATDPLSPATGLLSYVLMCPGLGLAPPRRAILHSTHTFGSLPPPSPFYYFPFGGGGGALVQGIPRRPQGTSSVTATSAYGHVTAEAFVRALLPPCL